MGLFKYLQNRAESSVIKENQKHPQLGQLQEDGSIYLGQSLDTELPPFLSDWNRKSWRLTSQFGLYVMPHDLTQEFKSKNFPTHYVDGIGEQVYQTEIHGHKDWRLPTTQELYSMYAYRNEGVLKGTFTTDIKNDEPKTKAWYLSSESTFGFQGRLCRSFNEKIIGAPQLVCRSFGQYNDGDELYINSRLIRSGPIL